jgi:hypothetical protein
MRALEHADALKGPEESSPKWAVRRGTPCWGRWGIPAELSWSASKTSPVKERYSGS